MQHTAFLSSCSFSEQAQVEISPEPAEGSPKGKWCAASDTTWIQIRTYNWNNRAAVAETSLETTQAIKNCRNYTKYNIKAAEQTPKSKIPCQLFSLACVSRTFLHFPMISNSHSELPSVMLSLSLLGQGKPCLFGRSKPGSVSHIFVTSWLDYSYMIHLGMKPTVIVKCQLQELGALAATSASNLPLLSRPPFGMKAKPNSRLSPDL